MTRATVGPSATIANGAVSTGRSTGGFGSVVGGGMLLIGIRRLRRQRTETLRTEDSRTADVSRLGQRDRAQRVRAQSTEADAFIVAVRSTKPRSGNRR